MITQAFAHNDRFYILLDGKIYYRSLKDGSRWIEMKLPSKEEPTGTGVVKAMTPKRKEESDAKEREREIDKLYGLKQS